MIDQLARTSAEDLRATTASDIEVNLADLHVRVVRHRRRTRIGLVAAAVVAVGLAATGGAVLNHREDRGVPPTKPEPSHEHAQGYCPTDIPVTCLDHHTYRFPLVQPVDWQIPAGYVFRSRDPVTPWLVESYRIDGHPGESGVTVMEHARASTPDGRGRPGGVGDTPRALANWIADRPFLLSGPVRQTQLDGRPAWQVRVTLAPDLPPGPADWDRSKCYAIVSQPVPGGGKSCLYSNFLSEYTVLTLPGPGTTVVWSWSFGENPGLGRLDQLIHGLSWNAR
jgi:hypothetical protein